MSKKENIPRGGLGDTILESYPLVKVATREGFPGRRRYRITERPGCVVILISGDIAILQARSDEGARSVSEADARDAFVVYGSVPPVNVNIEVDQLITADEWIGKGRLRIPVGIPEDEESREQLALFWAKPEFGGLSAARVREEIDISMSVHLRTAIRKLRGTELQKDAGGPIQELNAVAPTLVDPLLQSLKLERKGAITGEVIVEQPEIKDKEVYEHLRKQALEELGEESDAARVIYLLSTLHSVGSGQLRMWVEKESSKNREEQAARGVGVYRVGKDRNAGTLHRGEKIFLDVFADRAGYLHIFDLDADGGLSLLFPNDLCEDNSIPAGRFTLPDDAREMFGGEVAEWNILPDSPLGLERVKAILTTEKVDLLPRIGGQECLFYSRPARDAVGDVVAMVEKLNRMSSDAWSEAFCQFCIQE
ncbi:MAG: DUF4384 domain-containing protein [Gemmatimonadetes bacterium]|nr:DUF4384 domain-containing protein [Gemmatimonadota bacterium]